MDKEIKKTKEKKLKIFQKISTWNRNRLERRRNKKNKESVFNKEILKNCGKFTILTSVHCLYVANLMADVLLRAGKDVNIITETPVGGYGEDVYFVITPQIFNKLPKFYFSFQMEQSVNERWFTGKYFSILKESIGILDYSIKNIDFLLKNEIQRNKLFYVPIDKKSEATNNFKNNEKIYDVVFYGDVNNDRRKKYISALEANFSVLVIGNTFGEDLYEKISRAKVVVNIHYYEGALLETTRIYECLSLGLRIVSERSSDMAEHSRLFDVVDFVPVGDIDAMVACVANALVDEKIVNSGDDFSTPHSVVSGNQFDYYFNRFLLAFDIISFEHFYSETKNSICLDDGVVCLGLPESTGRKLSFDLDYQKESLEDFKYFPGLRHQIGWIGCGLSYKYLMMIAHERDVGMLSVCEDDVEFKCEWRKKYKNIVYFLKNYKSDWDLFSGLISDLNPETEIKAVENSCGIEFIKVNKMTGTVFNIYNKNIYKIMSNWDHQNFSPKDNTIDRYIENYKDISILTTCPFIFGHKEELDSTLWGINNSVYGKMISESEDRLKKLVDEWQSANSEAKYNTLSTE